MLSLRQTIPLIAVILFMAGLSVTDPQSPVTSTPPVTSQSFVFFHEFYGTFGYTDPEAGVQLARGSANGLTFTPPVVDGVAQLAQSFGAKLMLRLPDASSPAGISDEEINRQRQAYTTIAVANPHLAVTWDLMPEWDQSGGAWVPNGRPVYSGLSKSAAHARFTSHYRNLFPRLMQDLSQSSRPYQLAAVTDYPPNVTDAYAMGIDLCLLERGIDELGDLSTGIAFLRGAAQQYGRPWGIDLSSWRTGNDMATQYSNDNVLMGGWSASYLSRHYYVSFLAGANVIQNEAATYRSSNGKTNPFGQATDDFADFALRRHPDLGKPLVNVAFLISADSGFDPKHGPNNQSSSVWYQDIPYSSGDSMFDNLLRVAYPNFWLHGLAPGAPFANAAGVPLDPVKFQEYLASGGDPRPYEPMPVTRWGDNIDILTTDATLPAFNRYKVIVLTGEITLDTRLRSDLTTWVNGGGVLVMNINQTITADQTVTGVTLKNASIRSAASSTSLVTGMPQSEPPYFYTPINSGSADVLATNEFGDPLITRNKLGSGEVYLTSASYLQSVKRDQILVHGTQLLDMLFARNAVASVSGPPIEYIVNQLPGKIVVGLINNSAHTWNGTVTALGNRDSQWSVSEYVTDQPVESQPSPSGSTISVQVPAWGVSIFAFGSM